MSVIMNWDLNRIVTLETVLNALDKATDDVYCEHEFTCTECGEYVQGEGESYSDIDRDIFERLLLASSHLQFRSE